MGLGIFNKLSAPIVLKEDSNAEEQLRQIEYYLLVAPEATKQVIERDKQFVKYGIAGENAIMYELKNSHIPMYVLHDLYLEYEGLSFEILYRGDHFDEKAYRDIFHKLQENAYFDFSIKHRRLSDL